MKETTRECNMCGEVYLLNELNFYPTERGFYNTCRRCELEKKHKWRAAAENRVFKAKEAAGIKQGGPFTLEQVSNVPIRKNHKHTLTFVKNNQPSLTVEGIAIQVDDKMFTLETELGVRETYLKVDNLLGIYKID